jgi:tetratricopeptide (TPR) repeat protein
MRLMFVVRLILAAAVLLSVSFPAAAQSANDAANLEGAMAIFNNGDAPAALARVEDVLTRSPQNQIALFESASINFQLGNADAARGRLERLVKLAGNFAAAWELMAQVTQAQGDLARRDDAVARLKIAVTSALDPSIRRKGDYIRDRIPIGDKALYAADYWLRAGSDFTRYQFALNDPRMDPDHGLVLRTDAATTENWSATALLAQEKQLFHLDLVDRDPPRPDKVAVYEYYVGEPDYDTVRAEVLKILRGEVLPLSGEPGSLWGMLRP